MREAGVQAGATHRRIPGEPGIWILIGGDILLFSVFFATFGFYRRRDPALYAESQQMLHRGLGLVNTLILLASSWLVALGVHSARDRRARRAAALIGLAAVAGVGFLANKVLEWGSLFAQGVSVYTSEFFIFYFMYTGIHGLHVIIGVGVLTFLVLRLRQTQTAPVSMATLEGGAVFWHLVDILWILLFATLYLAN